VKKETKQKITYVWLALAAVATVVGHELDDGLINILSGVVANMLGWFVLLQIGFFVYEKVFSRNKNANNPVPDKE